MAWDGSMRRLRRFAVVFTLALAFVPFLPLYVERTMTHVMFAHGGGGAIEWGWKLCTLKTFLSNYRYFRHHPHPALWVTLNVGMALTYAFVIALIVDLVLCRKRLRTSRSASIAPPHN